MCSLDYDAISSIYDRLYGIEQLKKYSVCLQFTGGVGGLVLDAGCGTGLLYEYLRKCRSFEYVGLDSSLGMLLEARGKADERSHLVLGFVEFMPFRSHVFSTVFCFTVLHEASLESSLEEIARVLMSKGSLVVSMLKKLVNLHAELVEKCRRIGFKLVDVLDSDILKDVIFVFRCCDG